MSLPEFYSETITTTVRKCARCTEDHEDLTFETMRNPFDPNYPYWARCPNGYGPIILRSDMAK